MEPILKSVAREYTKRYCDLKPVCFLFPNKRCSVFFKKYLSECGVMTEDLPHILTISEFTSQVARKIEASRIEQLFILYKSYIDIIGDKGEEIEFEVFRGWGETVLGDFNTVDLYLHDSSEIFKNINDYRSLATDFLTEEQKEVMKEYFGVEDFQDSKRFWKQFDDPASTSELKKKFINLWQILGPLHQKFISVLSSKGLGSSGTIFREAAKKIEERGKEILPYLKIVAVGFNALNEAERIIFRSLQQIEGNPGYDDFADFIWDAAGYFLNSRDFSASRFVLSNKKHFPSPKWWQEIHTSEIDSDFPDFRIISAPSVTAQAKVAGEILKEYKTKEEKRRVADAEVALVLPDESLLPNLLYSLPETLGDINLTMGYSLKQTSVASFVSLLRRLFMSKREGKSTISFYSKDLKVFFAHPYAYILFQVSEIEKLMGHVLQFHKISVDNKEIENHIPSFFEILRFPSKNSKDDSVFRFLENVIDKLISKISEKNDKGYHTLDLEQIEIYRQYVEALEESLDRYGIKVSPGSAIHMIDKLISAEKIGFEGEPLSGLQIMGTLETRGLDFKHVIILSMNEGIMPRKANNSTFIPETLRKAYGLPPARYAEEIFGYYFYRLISRAERVTLVYDGRTISGLRGGESRYLLQLKHYLPKDKLKEEAWQYRLQNRTRRIVNITKTPGIKEMISCFSPEGKSRKNLSASSLNAFRECQVKFFLQNVMNLNSDPEKGDFMDEISIGQVLHNVMMDLYIPDEDLQRTLLDKPVVIDKDFIEKKLKHPSLINDLILKHINRVYYQNQDDSGKPLESGVADMIRVQLNDLIRDILKYDLSLAPFDLYGCEVSKNLTVTLSSGRKVNFRFEIDRLDCITLDGEKRLRIVDYKTGKKKREAKDLEEVFAGGYESEQIFQLFTYAWLLGKIGKDGWEDVITELYFETDLVKGETGYPSLAGEKVTSFRPFKDEFGERMETLVENIFQEAAFSETADTGICDHCSFRTICNK